MKFVGGNILNVKEGYILQHCNCVSLRPKGLSADLEAKYPGTCPYLFRHGDGKYASEQYRSKPGTVSIYGTEGNPQIINLFGQYYPGKPSPYGLDTYENRMKYFETALEGLIDYFEGSEEIIPIAVPYKISCRGGDWDDYSEMLLDFEAKMKRIGLDLELTVYYSP